VTDWVSTAASAATAVGTLILAVATFSSVRSAQRAARATERGLLAGIRPLLVPSRMDDPTQKVGFVDDHWVHIPGGRAVAEVANGVVYLAASLRNVGNGLAVLDRWHLRPERITEDLADTELVDFRRLTRDIYVPAGDTGFWQGAIRDPADPLFETAREAIEAPRPLTVDLLYGDHEGGQRTITRITLLPGPDGQWLVTGSRHWYLDRPSPR
jgi:hypothetical protein